MTGTVLYAIGDVHGRDDPLHDLHEAVLEHHAFFHGDAEALLIHIGDYIDRGARSADVIDRLMLGIAGWPMLCLRGNHEQMMLDCLESDDAETWEHWMQNGGGETLASFDLGDRFRDPQELANALGAERIAWLRALPFYHATKGYLFVHAGIEPGVPLEAQSEHDMLWIRGRFLDSDLDHGRIVVHGHTPTDRPDQRANRIGIDTGAVIQGHLTCVKLCPGERPGFLSARGQPGKGG